MSDLELRRFSNAAQETTLNGGISASSTSLDVATASGYPEAPFTIDIEGEIILVGSKSGTTFSGLTRSYDGSSSASAHSDGTTVKHVLTADDFDHRWQDVLVTYPHGDTDNEFDDGDASNLTEVDPTGTTTWTESNGVLSVVFSGQSSNDIAASVETISTIGIGSGVQTAARAIASEDYAYFGPLFSGGGTTTDNVVFQATVLEPDSSNMTLKLLSGTFTAASTEHFSLTVDPWAVGWVHMRLVWVGINSFRAWWSPDGVSWTDFDQGVFAITGINPPTRKGVGVSAWGGTEDKIASFDYTRIWSP